LPISSSSHFRANQYSVSGGSAFTTDAQKTASPQADISKPTRPGKHPGWRETIMNRIRRVAVTVAGLACAWLGLAVASPAAFAQTAMFPAPTGGGGDDAPAAAVPTIARVVVVGGMPGWQIALIAIGAALFAAASAVLVYRALATRRQAVTTTA
jgi:hypothetical protein